ncbi:hypothetical protein [Rhodanobacter geophilus]|uniref:Uncharacterized protein n=1 Tax=Rhodanobacter geophilus TaxID=3162488 RepID=A0ABV3QKD2_9GAMM
MKQVARKKVAASIGRGSDTIHASNHISDGAGSYLDHLTTELVEVSIADVVDSSIDSSGPVDDFIYLDIGSVDRERKTFVERKLIPLAEAPSRARQKVQAGDVLVSMTRPNLNAVAQVTQELHGSIASTGFHVLRSPWIETGFLYYLVQTDDFVDAMCGVVQGALYPAVRPRDIEGFKFYLPPRAEQTRIVEKLQELLSDLDAGVAELKAAQRKLAQYRQSLLKAAVEGTLTADWRVARASSNESQESGADLLQRILTERRTRWETRHLANFAEQGKPPPKGWQAKYPEPVAADTTDLPELPKGWVWASLDALIKEGPQNGLYLPSSLYGRGIPILRIDDYQIGWYRERDALSRVQADASISDAYELKSGDIVINRVNSMTHLGKCLEVPASLDAALFESNMMRMRLHGSVSTSYVAFYLGSVAGRARLTKDAKWAVNQASINQQDVRRTPVPLPSFEEQIAIVEQLDLHHEAIDAQLAAVDGSLQQSAAQRKNILKAAFAGQLVPQDPDDEPASVLLERIRAAKVEHAGKAKPVAKRGRKA